MDICDVEGDKACQITTLPRLLGRSRALLAASGMFAGGTLLSAHHVLTQVRWRWWRSDAVHDLCSF